MARSPVARAGLRQVRHAARMQDMRRLLPTVLIVCGALLVSAATWSLFRHGVVSTDTGLPMLGKVPEFSLIDSNGRPLSQAQLAGGVWVADFIFTRCPGVCPALSAQMA